MQHFSLRLSLALLCFAFTSGCACDVAPCPQECPDLCIDGACPGEAEPEPGAEPDGGPGGEPDVGPEVACSSDGECADGVCFGGSCQECNSGNDCDNGQTCESGTCVDDDECAVGTQCGNGGDCCPNGGDCLDGVCRAPCDTTRCGPDLVECCAVDDLCYGGGCAEVGEVCFSAADCGDDEVCEIDLGVCLDAEVVGSCEYIPPPGVFEPRIECRWTPSPDLLNPAQDDVVMAPVVGNLTDDNADGVTNRLDTPELVFISYDLEDTGCCNIPGTIRIVSGRCEDDGMRTIASLDSPSIDNSGGLALGDLDGDGVMEIVAMTIVDGQPQGTVAFKRSQADGSAWSVLWHNVTYPTWNVHTRGATQPALADLDGNGSVEVVVGNVVLQGIDGALAWDGLATVGPGSGIGNNAFLGPVSTAVDLDGDGVLEVLAGNTIYNADGTERVTFAFDTEGSGCGGTLPCDGYTAAANFDADPEGEVVIVRQGEVFILEHTGELLARIPIPVDDCPNNESGPPTIADFDGDGLAEIGTAAGDFYVVIDPDCTAADDNCQSDGILWAVPNQDCTSRVTASSVFDFEGDGAAEVIYADETTFRIFRGTDGFELFNDDTHGSHTRLEMAVIADVDNDGNAEVIIPENASRDGTPGVEVWGDALDNWVFTRRIWNQHSYHVTHVTEDGAITNGLQNWNTPGLNHFRQNSQGEGIFLAPDLVIEDVRGFCSPALELTMRFFVKNIGSRIVGAGVPVALYNTSEDPPVLLTTVATSEVLVPGQAQELEVVLPVNGFGVTFDVEVSVDDDGTGAGENNECDEDNNVRTRQVNCFLDG